MKLRLAHLALAALLGVCELAMAAPTSALRFQRVETLGPDELSTIAIIQDQQGFAWVGTHAAGLYRYNGYSSVKYTNNPHNDRSLPHDRVSALYQDGKGRIWAGTQNGLARFNPDSNDFTRFAPTEGPASRLIVKAIVGDGKDGLWLATWGGLQHFDPESGRFDVFLHDDKRPDSLASNDVNALAVDERGGLWVATWPGGLDYLAPGTTAFLHHRVADDDKANIVRALLFDRDHVLWIGTESNLLNWKSGTLWEARRTVATGTTRIQTLLQDRSGAIWAGTLASGLLQWDRGQDQPQHFVYRANDPHSVTANNIRALMQDRGGMLWVGTFTDGISLVNLNSQGFRRFIPFDEDAQGAGGPLQNNQITFMAGAPGGRLWLSGNSGFSLFDPASGEVLKSWRADPKKPGTLSNGIVYTLYQQPSGPLWLGTSAGLNRLDTQDGPIKAIHFANLASDFINVISPAAGGKLWIGTGADVVRYDPRDDSREVFAHKQGDQASRSVTGTTTIIEDPKGRVWMGSELNGGGLDRLDPGSRSFVHYRHIEGDENSLGDDTICVLYIDPKGRLWAGTSKGLNQVIEASDGHVTFKSYAFKKSVGHEKILAIRADAKGMLWVSTAFGLQRVNPDTGDVTHFNASDGLTDGFGNACSYAAPDGALYFCGVKGMTAVYADKVRKVSVAPQVAITDISVFNRSLKDGKRAADVNLAGNVTAPGHLTLSVQEGVFSLEFAALHYTDPTSNIYQYRLEGFDRNWVETDAAHRSATYTNLNPGEYTFQVKAANEQGTWSDQAATLAITIEPPFWMTWWFRILAAAGTLGILATAYRIRVRRLTRQQAMLKELVAERTRELEESNAKLAELSTTDGLTGITNRRGFDSALASEWRRAKRTSQPLMLAMLDVDHFKAYNDHYGHQAGDECLRRVAAAIAAHGRRTTDVVARYGGEEFALLAVGVSEEQAASIARSIVTSLQEEGIAHEGSPLGMVTASVGVACLVPSDDSSTEELIRQADAALYRAKQSGRNQAMGSPPSQG